MAATKLPPQNIEAEESVLGALMIDKNAIIKVADVLEPADFYKPSNGLVYKAILTLYEKSEPIDLLTITNQLKEEKTLDKIGGSTYLTKLIDGVPTASHINHYAKLVKEKRILRDLINTSAQITEKAFDPSDDIEDLLDDIEQKIFSISQGSVSQKFTSIKDELDGAYERMEKLHDGEGRLRGVATGFGKIDDLLSGLQRSDLVIVGARPSVGKTSLVLDMVRHIGVNEKKPVGIFSLEMSREQVTDRLIASEAGVPLWKLRTGKLTNETDFQLIQRALDTLSRAPIFIDDTPSPNILQMRSMARRLQAEHGLSALFVDYLQLIQPRNGINSMVQQITEISRGLKGLARELNTPVVALSQLSRATDQRDIKIPRLSDLRDSGCLVGGTLIMRADTGELVSIESLAKRTKQGPIPVYTLDENWQLVVRQLTKAFSSGKKRVYKLKMRSGRMVRASGNHPFRLLENWQMLEELKIGDKIAVPKALGTTSEVAWDEVVSIDEEGVEEVYDATVEGTHNFIANDIIVHNSIEQDADVVLFIYRKDRDKSNLDPEEENTAEIIIAKHRNGPLGSVKLKFNPETVSFKDIDTQRSAPSEF